MKWIAIALVVAGCSKKTETKPEAKEAPPPATAPAPTATPTPAPTAAAPAVEAAAMNICEWVTKEDVEKALETKIANITPEPAAPGTLGGCNWEFGSAAQHIAFVHAHPAGDYDDFVAGARNAPTKPVAGVGESALATSSGLLVKLAGKSYFLKFQVNDGYQDMDHPKAAALAKLIVGAAK